MGYNPITGEIARFYHGGYPSIWMSGFNKDLYARYGGWGRPSNLCYFKGAYANGGCQTPLIPKGPENVPWGSGWIAAFASVKWDKNRLREGGTAMKSQSAWKGPVTDAMKKYGIYAHCAKLSETGDIE